MGGCTKFAVDCATSWLCDEGACATGPYNILLAVTGSTELVGAAMSAAVSGSGATLPAPCHQIRQHNQSIVTNCICIIEVLLQWQHWRQSNLTQKEVLGAA